MVNVNIQIPDDLHKQLKLRSVLQNQALKELVVEILETNLKRGIKHGTGKHTYS